MFNPQDWYWAVAGSTTQVYASARNIYVPTTDSAYVAWRAAQGGSAAAIPNEADIWGYVSKPPLSRPAWLFNGTSFAQPTATTYTATQLIAYANQKQALIMTGGTQVAIGGGVNVECSTDAASLVLLQGAATIASANPAATFNWVPHTGSPISLTAAQITTMFGAVSSFLQATFTTLSGVIAAINAGTITTTAGVDSFASPAWPTNS